jgi:LysR family transcriptional regulator (chromosome initiation inhibitor)
MNPVLLLVQSQLRAATLVELVPGRNLAVALYCQHTRLPVPALDRLTRAVINATRLALDQ